VSEAVRSLAQVAKQAARRIASAPVDQRNHALEKIAVALERAAPEILAANAQDTAEAEAARGRGALERAGDLFERLVALVD